MCFAWKQDCRGAEAAGFLESRKWVSYMGRDLRRRTWKNLKVGFDKGDGRGYAKWRLSLSEGISLLAKQWDWTDCRNGGQQKTNLERAEAY
jgi:hypothetical protein